MTVAEQVARLQKLPGGGVIHLQAIHSGLASLLQGADPETRLGRTMMVANWHSVVVVAPKKGSKQHWPAETADLWVVVEWRSECSRSVRPSYSPISSVPGHNRMSFPRPAWL